MNVLVLTPFLPCRGKHGGAAQMFNLWSQVQDLDELNVHLLSHQTELEEGAADEARQTFHNIDIVPVTSPNEWLLGGYLSQNQHDSKYLSFLTETYINHLNDLLTNTKWDRVIIEMQFMMHFGRIVKQFVDCPVGLVVHESMGDRYKDAPVMLNDFVEYQKQFEEYVDFLICFSDEDMMSVSRQGKVVYSLPLCVNVENSYSVQRTQGEMMFLGSYNHQPNVDAVNYLLNDILPLVKSSYNLKICGAQLTDSMREKWKNYPNVEVVGFVDDAIFSMSQCHVMVAPIISGKGVRTKTVEALSQNTPVITTSLGAEGVDVVDGEDILIADTSIAFASAIDSILQNKILIGNNAVDKVAKHSADNVAKIMQEILLSASNG